MMLSRLIFRFMALIAAASVLEACDDVPEPADRFEVTPSALTVDALGGQVSFSVLSSEDWMASVNQSWANLMTVKGKGSETAVTVKVSVSENPDTEQRTAAIKISTLSGKSQSVELVQAAGSGMAGAD